MAAATKQAPNKITPKQVGAKFVSNLPFLIFFAVLFFTEYLLFGVSDALIGIAFLFFARNMVNEPGLSFANYAHRVAWFFVMSMASTLAGLHPVLMVGVTLVYLFFVTLFNSDDYLSRNYYWLGMGYLLLLIYPVQVGDIWMRVVATIISIVMTTAFVYLMRTIDAKTGRVNIFKRDRSYVKRAFDDVGAQLQALVAVSKQGKDTAPALDNTNFAADGTETENIHPTQTYGIAQEYARCEYATVFRQGGLLSGRQSYTFALLLYCEQIADMIHAMALRAERVTEEERHYFEDLADVFLAYGQGSVKSVSQMVARLEEFIRTHTLPSTCNEEAWTGVLAALLRTLRDTRLSTDNHTPFIKSIKYRFHFLRDNVGLRHTQTRFALQMSITVTIGMIINVLLTHYAQAQMAIWIPLTSFTMLNTYRDETLKATRDNIIGTFLGIAVFVLFIHFIPASIRMPIVVILSYGIILMALGPIPSITAGTQMALAALYPMATLGDTLVSRLVLVVLAVSCVMMLIFVVMSTHRSNTIHAKVRELERIDVRLVQVIRTGIKTGRVNLWRTAQLLYYMHMNSWLLESLAKSLDSAATAKHNLKRQAELQQLRADIRTVLQANYRFGMEAEHAVMLLDPRRSTDIGKTQTATTTWSNPDTTDRIEHIDATSERLDKKMLELEKMRYLEEDDE